MAVSKIVINEQDERARKMGVDVTQLQDADALGISYCEPCDIHDLLNSFVGYVRESLPCEGIEYVNEEMEIYYIDGEIESSSASYDLVFDEFHLGTMRLTRAIAFEREEMEAIEKLLAGLVDPLRHALGFYRELNCYANNSNRYYEKLQMEIERCKRTGRDLSIIKLIPAAPEQLFNTTGDWYDEDAIIQLVDLIDHHSRRIDTVYRLSEDEYMVMLPYTDAATASFVAERLTREISQEPVEAGGSAHQIELCAGVATYQTSDEAISLINRAENEVLRAQIRHSGGVKLVQDDVHDEEGDHS